MSPHDIFLGLVIHIEFSEPRLDGILVRMVKDHGGRIYRDPHSREISHLLVGGHGLQKRRYWIPNDIYGKRDDYKAWTTEQYICRFGRIDEDKVVTSIIREKEKNVISKDWITAFLRAGRRVDQRPFEISGYRSNGSTALPARPKSPPRPISPPPPGTNRDRLELVDNWTATLHEQSASSPSIRQLSANYVPRQSRYEPQNDPRVQPALLPPFARQEPNVAAAGIMSTTSKTSSSLRNDHTAESFESKDGPSAQMEEAGNVTDVPMKSAESDMEDRLQIDQCPTSAGLFTGAVDMSTRSMDTPAEATPLVTVAPIPLNTVNSSRMLMRRRKSKSGNSDTRDVHRATESVELLQVDKIAGTTNCDFTGKTSHVNHEMLIDTSSPFVTICTSPSLASASMRQRSASPQSISWGEEPFFAPFGVPMTFHVLCAGAVKRKMELLIEQMGGGELAPLERATYIVLDQKVGCYLPATDDRETAWKVTNGTKSRLAVSQEWIDHCTRVGMMVDPRSYQVTFDPEASIPLDYEWLNDDRTRSDSPVGVGLDEDYDDLADFDSFRGSPEPFVQANTATPATIEEFQPDRNPVDTGLLINTNVMSGHISADRNVSMEHDEGMEDEVDDPEYEEEDGEYHESDDEHDAGQSTVGRSIALKPLHKTDKEIPWKDRQHAHQRKFVTKRDRFQYVTLMRELGDWQKKGNCSGGANNFCRVMDVKYPDKRVMKVTFVTMYYRYREQYAAAFPRLAMRARIGSRRV